MTNGIPAIQLSDVCMVYGKKTGSQFTALDRVSIDIWDGEFFTLLGPSGCGKTTLLRLIAGFGMATSGHIRLFGQDIGGLPPNRRPVNTVFQSYALFPNQTVRENIAFGLEMLDRPKAEIAARVERMLDLVQLEKMADRKPSQLSGGQQQRVALARALAPEPRVLLLDEPLSALDQKLRKSMQIELKRLQAETGLTFIFVTHDQEEAMAMSDRIGVMNAGHLLQVGTSEQIYQQPANRFVAQFIGDTNLCSGHVRDLGEKTARISLSFGAEVEVHRSAALASGQKVVVAIRPEHVQLTLPTGSQTAHGMVESVLYLGTDTHFDVRLSTGDSFAVRRQNRARPESSIAAGTPVCLVIDEGAARVLVD